MQTTTPIKISHIQSRRNAYQRCRHRVMILLQWDENTYNNFWLDAGKEYLLSYLNGDIHATDQFRSEIQFWKWWLNHWTMREETFLINTNELHQKDIFSREQQYKLLHHPQLLANEIFPDSVLLNDSFDSMFYQIINDQLCTLQATR